MTECMLIVNQFCGCSNKRLVTVELFCVSVTENAELIYWHWGPPEVTLIVCRCGHIRVKSSSFLHRICLCAVSVHTPSDRRN